MNVYFHSTQQHGTAWYFVIWDFLLPGTKQSNGLAHRCLPLHRTGVLDTEAGPTMKRRKAQSPVVSCTAVFTGASSLKTEDILRRVVTTFSTSDVSV